ncbi:hypothetical protein FHR72_004093 [Mycolicibacterium iranicum]|uniref:SCP domain-containing protein n=1 Tax=Mycolicibacterium iranicum TaxID=912594 RepID=A0A839QH86_MYCIR|nr:hypothetical protein [Mycolicibacterium iranicum]MBB2992592.1 hypothetical protein [Mycolicibacterium iranicum]
MNTNPFHLRTALTRAAVVATGAGAVALSVVGAPAASASPQDDLWRMINDRHVAAGCAPYGGSQALVDTAVSIAKTMVNPPGGIAGNGRVPADSMLAGRGYHVTSWGEADYIINGQGSPQAALDFWMNNPTRDIFPNCNNRDLATAVWIQNGKWAAVALAASPGGTPAAPPIVR